MVVAAAGGGLVAASSSLTPELWPTMLLGLAVLAWTVADATSVRSAALRAGVWAVSGQLVVLRFLVPTVDRFTDLGPAGGVLAVVLVSVGQSLAWAGGGAIAHVLRGRACLPSPVAFAGGVLGTTMVPGVLGWTPAGLVAARPELVQVAEIGGERAATLILCLVAATAVAGLDRRPASRRLAPIAAASLGLLVVGALGAWRMDRVSAAAAREERIPVALVSQDTPARLSPDAEPAPVVLARLQALSRRADAAGAALVAWPEAAYPYPSSHGAGDIGGSASPLSPGARAPRLIGLQTVAPEDGRSYNSATIVESGGGLQRSYDKRKLLWFGETIPFADVLPALRRLFPKASATTPGDGSQPLVLRRPGGKPAVRVGVLICYEDMSGSVARTAARAEARLLVDVSNDAWFAETSAPALHDRLAALRAVETRTSLVRSVNAGPSSWVDPTGRVKARRNGDHAGVLLAHPVLRAPDASPTLYSRYGDGPLLSLVLVACALGLLRTRKRSP